MHEAILFNIQKFCVHDGPGIRTSLFFKGCTMNCAWCHNPESKSFQHEISHDKDKCSLCGNCVNLCPQDRLLIEEGIVKTIKDIKCSGCENCTDMCTQMAREMAGSTNTADTLFEAILSDQKFYETSNGGVTFSGGEVLCQVDMVQELSKKCQKRGIHVAIDTCGNVPYSHFERVIPYTDLFLYDIKLLKDEDHKRWTGVTNKTILDNFNRLVKDHEHVWLRIPIVDGVNATNAFIEDLCLFLQGKQVEQVHLLPYHAIAIDKYRRFGQTYNQDQFARPTDAWLASAKDKLESAGFKTIIGG